MDLTREELLRQRALLRQHLDWIEAKLAAFPTPHSTTPPPAPPPAVSAHPPAVSAPPLAAPPPAVSVSPPAVPAPLLAAPLAPSAAANGRSSLPAPTPDPADFLEARPSLTPRSLQTGCILLLVLASALVLFFFLVLPYLLPPRDARESASAPPTRSSSGPAGLSPSRALMVALPS